MSDRTIKKVPLIMQVEESVDCGAASLGMILAYYGRWVGLEQLRRDCGVRSDGAKASNILRAARSYGLEAKGFRLDAEEFMKEAAFPCIAYWNAHHWVVVREMKSV